MTLALRVGGQHHAPAVLPLGERLCTHCTGGWMGPRAGLDGGGKSRPPPPNGIRTPNRPACSESLFRLSYRSAAPSKGGTDFIFRVALKIQAIVSLETSVTYLPATRRHIVEGCGWYLQQCCCVNVKYRTIWFWSLGC